MKSCTKCGEEKPLDAFYAVARGLYGRGSMCKECFSAYHKTKREADPERYRRNYREWAAEHREQRREYIADWRADHPGKVIANKQAYYASYPEYGCWKRMIARCTQPRTKSYDRYGGRGITVFADWLGWPDGFQRFVKHIGPRPSRLYSIDRIENDGHYEPGNVRWATAKEQAQNRS